MKRKFTFLMAAFTLLAFLVPITGWGQTTVASFSRSGSTDTYTEGQTFTKVAEPKTGYYQDGTGTAGTTEKYLQLKGSTAYWTTTPESISFTAKLGGGTTKDPLDKNVLVALLDNEGNVIEGTSTIVTTKITNTTGSEFTVSVPAVNNAYGVKISHIKETGFNVRYYSFSLSYVEAGGSTTTPTTVTIDASGITNTDLYIGTEAGQLTATVKDNNNTIIEGATVTWESNDDDIATIDANGVVTLVAVGSTTITASYAGNDTYGSSSATYTIEVTDTTPVTGSTFIFNTDDGLEALNITKPSSGAGTDLDPDTDYTIGDVTMNITHGTTNTRVWNSSGNTDLRVYSNGTLAFTVPEGNAITKITFDGNTIALSGVNNSVWTATGDPVSTVAFTNNTTASKIRTITVEYEATVPPTVAAPVFSPEAGTYTEPKSVTITCATEGSTIYYTLDGSTPDNNSTQYNGAITVSVTTTIKAIAYNGEDHSNVATAAYVIELPTVATPTFDPVAGTYAGAQTVTIACATEGATIYYTLDGEDPTIESTVYYMPFTISQTTTVKAMAVKNNYNNSAIAEAAYTIIPSVPGYVIDFENAASAYTDWEFVNIVSQQTGANNVSAHGGTYYGTTGGKASGKIVTKEKIATPYILTCYVTRQSTNTTASTWYIQVSSDGEAWTNVATQSATSMTVGTWVEFSANLTQYTDVYVRLCYEGSTAVRNIDDLTLITTVPAVATPTFSPEAGTYYEAQNVTIACTTEGATIYYTTNGTTPDNTSTQYDGAITVSETTTINAIAYVGEDVSSVATATYTIVMPMTIAQVREQGTGDVLTTGTITSISGNGTKTAYMQDATAAIVVYGSFTAAVGDAIRVSGTLEDHHGLLEIKNPSVTVISSGNTINPELMTIAQINASTNQGWYIRIEGATVTGKTGDNTTISQGENTVNVYKISGVNVDDVISFNGNIGCYDNLQIVNPRDVTVAPAGFAYQYSINGVPGNELYGTNITLSNGAAVGGLAFAGWTLDPNDVENILAAGSPYELTADGVVFYAVYSRTVASGSYVRVTESPDDWTGNYLIVNQEYGVAFNGAVQPKLDIESNTISISVNGNSISANYETNAGIFTITPTADGDSVIIQSASGLYMGQNADANGLLSSTSIEYHNAISFGGDTVNIIGRGGAYLRYNKASNQNRFRYYKTSSYLGQKPIQLFKQEGEITTTSSFYTRVFVNETATAAIQIVGPSIIPSNYSLNMATYTLTNELGAANLVIEEGGQLIHSEGNVAVTMQKHINQYTGAHDNYYLIAAPFQVDPSTVSGMLDNDYDLYSFASWAPGEEWQNYEAEGGEFWLQEGQGFLYANNVDTDLEFVGQVAPSTDDDFYYGGLYDESSTDPFNGWSLAGNPFACNAYPVLNDGTAASFYKISGDELVLSEENYMRPLEGIFMQETDESTQYFFNRTEPAPSRAIDLTVMSVARGTANCDRVRVRFDNGNNFGKFQLNQNHTKLYFTQGNRDFAVVRSANEGEMPVNFKAETNGTYTISVNAENVNMSYLHLIDNVTGADVDLLSTPSYSFEANTNDYATRFRLVFKANANVSENVDAVTFAFFNGSTWTISNVGEATLQVVDVMGRVLSSETINGNAEISIKQEPGVYMLRLINGDNVKTQKVVVR
ncbi:MAG: chitobiase/beta-hexosaminidase C-terminal domain-containing protein [Bacteroidales bacterium]|nr:chitobiase/beta-hexosaminidase C-terminal domain-containing protein [Bacteroidales bacterium]